MIASRPPIQLTLDLPEPGRGEAPRPDGQKAEVITATSGPESPTKVGSLMEAICEPDNMEAALRAVMRNKGTAGIDRMTVGQLPGVMRQRWPDIERQLLEGRYRPSPVLRVKIPKPAGGTVI